MLRAIRLEVRTLDSGLLLGVDLHVLGEFVVALDVGVGVPGGCGERAKVPSDDLGPLQTVT